MAQRYIFQTACFNGHTCGPYAIGANAAKFSAFGLALFSSFEGSIKILPRISVGGISVVSSVCVCAVVDGSLDLFARSTCFFI
jgi:hypothetical protein